MSSYLRARLLGNTNLIHFLPTLEKHPSFTWLNDMHSFTQILFIPNIIFLVPPGNHGSEPKATVRLASTSVLYLGLSFLLPLKRPGNKQTKQKN